MANAYQAQILALQQQVQTLSGMLSRAVKTGQDATLGALGITGPVSADSLKAEAAKLKWYAEKQPGYDAIVKELTDKRALLDTQSADFEALKTAMSSLTSATGLADKIGGGLPVGASGYLDFAYPSSGSDLLTALAAAQNPNGGNMQRKSDNKSGGFMGLVKLAVLLVAIWYGGKWVIKKVG